MAQLKFKISAHVSSHNPSTFKPESLKEKARDLTRMILSALLTATTCPRVGTRIVSNYH